MRLGKYFLAAAAASMAVAPAMAAPVNPASSLSVAKSVRAGATTSNNSQLAGGGGFIIAIIAVVVVIAGIIIVADNDDKPDSP